MGTLIGLFKNGLFSIFAFFLPILLHTLLRICFEPFDIPKRKWREGLNEAEDFNCVFQVLKLTFTSIF